MSWKLQSNDKILVNISVNELFLTGILYTNLSPFVKRSGGTFNFQVQHRLVHRISEGVPRKYAAIKTILEGKIHKMKGHAFVAHTPDEN